MKRFSLEEYLKDPSRKVVTRDGKAVRIICTDAKGICPVVGLVAYENYELAFNVMKDGRIDGILDLFFAPEKHEGWVNMYRDSNNGHTTGAVFDSPEDAERVGQQKLFSYVATIKVEWEE